METPFEIGKTYYLPQMNPYQIEVPCPVCNGKKSITVIDGNDVVWSVACEACGLGFDDSRGFINEYCYKPSVKPFTVKSIKSFHSDGTWYLTSIEGDSSRWDCLTISFEEAALKSEIRLKEIVEDNYRRSASMNKTMLKKAAWSLRYHKECLQNLDRQKAYHESKIKEQGG